MQIVVTGFSRHGPPLARLLSECVPGVHAVFYRDVRTALARAAAHAVYADAAISFGGPTPQELVQRICDLRHRPMILLWAGSDVVTIARRPAELERLRLARIVHWASGPRLAAELTALGIPARYIVTASAPIPVKPCPLPSAFTVLTYLPKPRREFYGQGAVWEAARALGDVRFIAVGTGGPEPGAPPNIEYVGDVDNMTERYDGATVLLRLPQHDSLSQGVIEALARGRHVIWNDRLPGCIYADCAAQAIDALHALRRAHDEQRLEVNHAGLEYVASQHDPATVASGIVQEVRNAMELASAQNGRAKVRVAISGHEIFSARIAANFRRHDLSISASVLSTRSRTEAAMSMVDILGSDIWYTVAQPAAPRALEFAALLLRKRRIVHWLGSDVDEVQKNPALLKRLRSRRFLHLAQSEEIAVRLREIGLEAKVVPVAAAAPVSHVPPLPEAFTLMLYLPEQRPESYGRYQFEQLMSALPSEAVRYIVVGGGRIDAPSSVSVERVRWAPFLGELYARSTAFVRFAEPAFLSTMIIEALLYGRYVLSSNDFPFVQHIRDSHELEHRVRQLLEAHREGTLRPQFDAADKMRSVYSPEQCVRLLADVCA